MNTKLLLIIVCVVAAAHAMAAEQVPGRAECAPKSGASVCALQWDFALAPRGFYQVEYLNENSLKWQAVGQPYSALHKNSGPVPVARLYRVRGCDDEAMHRNCVHSTVHWAVSRPAVDDIPDFLVDGYGIEMHVLKGAPASVQIAQYNVYRLIQLLDRIPDLSKLPPMTAPPAWQGLAAGRDGDLETLTGIYENYRARRQLAMQKD
jgi:hypothetical protein